MDQRPKSVKYLIRILAMLIVAALVIVIAANARPKEEQAHGSFQIQYDLTLWYYDETLTSYLTSFGDDYFKTAGKRVDVQLVPSLEFFDRINQLNVEGQGAPDLYVIDSSKLENAYLSALAKPNTDPVYTEEAFLSKALSAATYRDILVGYPLCFNTSFFACRTEKQAPTPAYLSEITEGLEFDVSDLLYTYFFIGGQIDLGGPDGDDAATFDLSSKDYTRALKFMKKFSKKLSLDVKLSDYRTIERDFIQGKCDMGIFSLPSLIKLYGSGASFSVSRIPDLKENLPSRPLSQTSVVCVNPESPVVADAEALANYLTYEHADAIYEECSLLSTKKTDYEQADFNLITDIYENSASLPKLIETENIWENLNTLLTSVWSGEDIEKAQSKLNVAIYVALSTRTEQEDR